MNRDAAGINVDFLELYKKVDAFIRDAYGSQEGVSEYLKLMEADGDGSNFCLTWDEDYQLLKKARWQRNQLSHAVSIDNKFCEEEDLAWLEEFFERLCSTADPLAVSYRENSRQQKANKAFLADNAKEKYELAIRKMNAADSQSAFLHAASVFESLGDYQASKFYAKKCREKSDEIENKAQEEKSRKKQEKYDRAISLMETALMESAFLRAADLFDEVGDYKDSIQRSQDCRQKAAEANAKEIQYQRAVAGAIAGDEKSLEEAIVLFTNLGLWRDSQSLLADCQRRLFCINQENKAEQAPRQDDIAEEKQDIPQTDLPKTVVVETQTVVENPPHQVEQKAAPRKERNSFEIFLATALVLILLLFLKPWQNCQNPLHPSEESTSQSSPQESNTAEEREESAESEESHAHTVSEDWIVTKEATCTENGIAQRVCSLCGAELETKIIEPTGHVPGNWIIDKEATITSTGSRHKVCTKCGKTLESGQIPMIGHTCSFGDWIVDVESTCSACGHEYRICEICGLIEEADMILLPHTPSNEWLTVRDATCTEDGSAYNTCSVCGQRLQTIFIPALGHEGGHWTTESEATYCNEHGTEKEICPRCNAVLSTREITGIEHFWIDATCTEPRTCSSCGLTEGEALGHVLEDGICSRCGYVADRYISRIEILDPPTQTEYYTGDALNTAGLRLTAYYNTGETETISSGFTCTPNTFNTTGTQTITVTLGTKQTTFQVQVEAVVIVGISVVTPPTKTQYMVSEELDPSGLVIRVAYNHGPSVDLNSGFSCGLHTIGRAGTITVPVSYLGCETSFTISAQMPPVGTEITFGGYEWIVIDTSPAEVFLLSKYVLCQRSWNSNSYPGDSRPYSVSGWLNGPFLNSFTAAEQAKLVTPWRYRTTSNKVFLMSVNPYLVPNDPWIIATMEGSSTPVSYWITLPADTPLNPKIPFIINTSGNCVTASASQAYGVRPIIYVDFSD